MSRVAGVSGKHLRELAEQLGWTLDHWRGDHMLFKKAGERLTISIPDDATIAPGTPPRITRDLGLSIDDLMRLLGR